MKLIKAKVELIIEVPDTSEGYMADSVSAILTENLETNGIIVDWAYSDNEKPVYIGEHKDYKEGDAFIK